MPDTWSHFESAFLHGKLHTIRESFRNAGCEDEPRRVEHFVVTRQKWKLAASCVVEFSYHRIYSVVTMDFSYHSTQQRDDR